MLDGLFLFLSSFYAVLVVVVGAASAAIFQQRNWHHQNQLKILADQKAHAFSVVEDLARSMDRRLFRQRRYLWSLQSNSDIGPARGAYDEAVIEWNDNFGRLKAGVLLAFGEERRDGLEAIHDVLQRVGRVLEKAHGTKRNRKTLSKLEDELSQLHGRIYKFNYRLLKAIEEHRIFPSTNRTPVISFSNYNQLSTLYLLRRLFDSRVKMDGIPHSS